MRSNSVAHRGQYFQPSMNPMGGSVSDQPEATEVEQEEAASGGREEHEAMAGPGHEDPEQVEEEDGEQ